MSDSKLKDALKTWEETTLKKTLDATPERKKSFTTISNHDIRRLYTPLDSENVNYERDLGNPG